MLPDLSAFRSALVDLTYQIDELENLKYGHYRTALDLAQTSSVKVLDSAALVVRAEIEVFEKIAQKGWDSSGGLDDLIARAADPFAADPTSAAGEGEIFSILPTESILPSPHGALSRAGSITGAGVSAPSEGKYHSLTGALSQNGDYDEYEDEDGRSIFSGGFSNPGSTKAKLHLPGFSPAPSSAGWGQQENDQNQNGEGVPRVSLPSDTEGSDARSNISRTASMKENDGGGGGGGGLWRDEDADSEACTIRDHSF